MSKKLFQCAIIGGGASSALAALAILKHSPLENLKLTIIDPHDELGRGVAYAKTQHSDLLNVSAAKMSADADQPEDFVQWLKLKHRIDKSFPSWPYIPRTLYGEYLNHHVNSFIGKQLVHKKAKVKTLAKEVSSYQLTLDNGETLEADIVLICTGYSPITEEPTDTEKSKKILIVGSGLSAIDLWRRHREDKLSTFTFISRHGLFPLRHENHEKIIALPQLSGLSPRQIFSKIRLLKVQADPPWPTVADSLRGQVSAIWSRWSLRERGQFLRHLKVYWEVIRHRVPEKVHDELSIDLASGRAQIIAGRVLPRYPGLP